MPSKMAGVGSTSKKYVSFGCRERKASLFRKNYIAVLQSACSRKHINRHFPCAKGTFFSSDLCNIYPTQRACSCTTCNFSNSAKLLMCTVKITLLDVTVHHPQCFQSLSFLENVIRKLGFLLFPHLF